MAVQSTARWPLQKLQLHEVQPADGAGVYHAAARQARAQIDVLLAAFGLSEETSDVLIASHVGVPSVHYFIGGEKLPMRPLG
ncbi:hypothetical protein [Streptomyces sp. 1222.5]|uniref:hypothetical protein n=1 Tax=Streptomyces sp. 1222.5 TaxID=1881026 RepID=UPI003D718D34